MITNHAAGDGASDRVPVESGARAVEAWLASAGLDATVVARCPDPGCEVCARTLPRAA